MMPAAGKPGRVFLWNLQRKVEFVAMVVKLHNNVIFLCLGLARNYIIM